MHQPGAGARRRGGRGGPTGVAGQRLGPASRLLLAALAGRMPSHLSRHRAHPGPKPGCSVWRPCGGTGWAAGTPVPRDAAGTRPASRHGPARQGGSTWTVGKGGTQPEVCVALPVRVHLACDERHRSRLAKAALKLACAMQASRLSHSGLFVLPLGQHSSCRAGNKAWAATSSAMSTPHSSPSVRSTTHLLGNAGRRQQPAVLLKLERTHQVCGPLLAGARRGHKCCHLSELCWWRLLPG